MAVVVAAVAVVGSECTRAEKLKDCGDVLDLNCYEFQIKLNDHR